MTYSRTGSLAALRTRAAALARIRAFFEQRGVLEVETPFLSSSGVSDIALDSVVARLRSLGVPQYLHTSPEYAMKRLLASGSGDIYQLCRVFRDDELGRWHQPEFTMLEWYRIGWDDARLMGEVEELFVDILSQVHPLARRGEESSAAPAAQRWGADGENRVRLSAVRLRYDDALEGALGMRSDAATLEIRARLIERGVDVPEGLTHDAVLDLAFATIVVPSFAPGALTFLHDYPASQAALARLKPGTPPTAARFEVFCGSIELANGFHELNDAAEQRRRFEAELDARRRSGRDTPPLDEALLGALRDLPDCSGVAVGVDRLLALALGLNAIAAAMSFAHLPPDAVP